jgi:lysozyme
MTYPTRDGYVLGIDASGYQGTIDWPSLADAGVRYAVLKATEGATGTDGQFIKSCISVANEPRIRVVCPYHFLVTTSSPHAQANALWNMAGRYASGRPVIDFEEQAFAGLSRAQAVNALLTCLNATAQQWGCAPILYTSPSFVAEVKDVPGAWNKLSAYDLWVAEWTVHGLRVPAPWTKALLWQFDGDGGLRMPNGTDADFDWFEGTEDELVARLARTIDDGDVRTRQTLPPPPGEQP